MDPLALLLEKVFKGEDAVLPAKSPLEAKALQGYLTGQLIYSASDGKPKTAFRFVIHNAVFGEVLDMKDGRKVDGSALPALEFHNCEFQQGVCLDGAHLSRLLFSDCHFTSTSRDRNFISLKNSRVDTEVRIVKLRPSLPRPTSVAAEITGTASHLNAEQSQELQWMWIDAFAISVGANFILQDTFLRAPDDSYCAVLEEDRFALDLSTADIHCDLRLQSRVTLEGGLKMRNARVGGSVWAQGLRTTDGGTFNPAQSNRDRRQAFRMESTSIDGDLSLNVDETDRAEIDIEQRRFRCEGMLNLGGLRLKGSLFMTAAKIGVPEANSVSLVGASIGRDLQASSYQEHDLKDAFKKKPLRLEIPGGQLLLAGCRTQGDCDIMLQCRNMFASGASIEGSLSISGDVEYVDASQAKIARDFTLSVKGASQLRLSGMRVEGNLDLSRSAYFFHFSVDGSNLPRLLLLDNSEIGHQLTIAETSSIESAWHWPHLSFYPSRNNKKNISLWQVELSTEENRLNHTKTTIMWLAQDDNKGHSKPIVLDGRSNPIHWLNGSKDGLTAPEAEQRIDLATVEKATDYLNFFCAAVWGDAGAFAIVDKSSRLPATYREALVKELASTTSSKADPDQEGAFLFTRMLRYGKHLFRAELRVQPDGMIEMLSEEAVTLTTPDEATQSAAQTDDTAYEAGERLALPNAFSAVNFSPDEVPEYKTPLRTSKQAADDLPDNLDSTRIGGERRRLEANELKEKSQEWKQFLHTNLRGISISIRNARCGTLDDDAGRAWGGANVELENFEYKTTVMPRGLLEREEVRSRKRWLSNNWDPEPKGFYGRYSAWLRGNWKRLRSRRSARNQSDTDKFRAQPYAHLAKVMRERGDDDSARDIEAERMRLASYDRAKDFRGRAEILWWWFYGPLFRFGLSPLRALGVLLGFWVIGWLAISMLDDSKILTANVNTVAAAKRALPDGSITPDIPVVQGGPKFAPVTCGKIISPPLYAVELITPGLNFHQAGRCDIETSAAVDQGASTLQLWGLHHTVYPWLRSPLLWELLRGVYVLVGTVVTSLALLTFSGIARRWEH